MKKSALALLLASTLFVASCDEKQTAQQAPKPSTQQAAQQADFPTLLVKIQTLFERSETVKHTKKPEDDEYFVESTEFERSYSVPVTQIEWLDKLLLAELFMQISAENEPLPANLTHAMLVERFKKNYQADLAEVKADRPIGDSDQIQADYLGQRNHIASFTLFRHIYTGGAHGSYRTNIINVDTQKKAIIRLDDLIPTQHQAEVIEKLWEAYRQERLDEHGKYNGFAEKSDIRLPENFRFTPAGIAFVYGIYELGSFAEGEIEVLLDWETLTPLMNPEYRWK